MLDVNFGVVVHVQKLFEFLFEGGEFSVQLLGNLDEGVEPMVTVRGLEFRDFVSQEVDELEGHGKLVFG